MTLAVRALSFCFESFVTGEYRTAVERHNGSAGTNYSMVYGLANDRDTNTAIALFVVWNNGMSVTGWVGKLSLSSSAQRSCVVVNLSFSMLS